jgi:adenylosuccinate synthase
VTLIVHGLGFGDEGKGTMVEYYSRVNPFSMNVRFNGGHQAGHNIVRPDGTWHCFAQLGSGSFEGADTHLSQFMFVEPMALLVEADVLAGKGVNTLEHLTVDPRCTIVTPAHKMTNQMREQARGADRHGTCGCGVGDAALNKRDGLSVSVGDIGTVELDKKLEEIFRVRGEEADRLATQHPTPDMLELHAYFKQRMNIDNLKADYAEFRERVRLAGSERLHGRRSVIFEGSQGTLLDPEHGFGPYVTKSRSTHHNAIEVLRDGMLDDEPMRIGVLAAYMHRHGPGPLPTEDPAIQAHLSDPYNQTNRWQGRFRVGWFDLVLARYAIDVNDGIHALALTKIDRLNGLPEVKVCLSYLFTGPASMLDGLVDTAERRSDNETVIYQFKAGCGGERLTPILNACRPHEWRTFPGWDDPYGYSAIGFISSIQDLLGVPVDVVSMGPTYESKRMFYP